MDSSNSPANPNNVPPDLHWSQQPLARAIVERNSQTRRHLQVTVDGLLARELQSQAYRMKLRSADSYRTLLAGEIIDLERDAASESVRDANESVSSGDDSDLNSSMLRMIVDISLGDYDGDLTIEFSPSKTKKAIDDADPRIREIVDLTSDSGVIYVTPTFETITIEDDV